MSIRDRIHRERFAHRSKALAALAVAGVGSAQSSVTLFGVLDATFSGYSNKSENAFGQDVKVQKNQLRNSGYKAPHHSDPVAIGRDA
jgi:hypothetical protein